MYVSRKAFGGEEASIRPLRGDLVCGARGGRGPGGLRGGRGLQGMPPTCQGGKRTRGGGQPANIHHPGTYCTYHNSGAQFTQPQ